MRSTLLNIPSNSCQLPAGELPVQAGESFFARDVRATLCRGMWVGMALSLWVGGTFLSAHADTEPRFRTAREHYEQARYEEARTTFESLWERRPKDLRLAFNAGAAAYRQGDYEAASRHFEAALESADLALQQKGFYNRGNSRVRQGEVLEDPAQRRSYWEAAVEDYRAALGLNPTDEAAETNLRRIEALLQEDPEQQPETDESCESDESEGGDGEDESEGADGDDESEGTDESDGKDGSEESEGADGSDESEQGEQGEQGQQGDGQNGRQDGDSGMERPENRSDSDPTGESEGPRAMNPEKETDGDSDGEGADGAANQAGGGRADTETVPLRMSLEQAERVLDDARAEERALIWRPAEPSAQDKRRSAGRRKTW